MRTILYFSKQANTVQKKLDERSMNIISVLIQQKCFGLKMSQIDRTFIRIFISTEISVYSSQIEMTGRRAADFFDGE